MQSLPPDLQAKYWQQRGNSPAGQTAAFNGSTKKDSRAKPAKTGRGYEELSAEERGEAGLWESILDEWACFRQYHREQPKGLADAEFVRQLAFGYGCLLETNRGKTLRYQTSAKTLYAKKAQLQEARQTGNWELLIDMRNKSRRGKSRMDNTIWSAFLYYFMTYYEAAKGNKGTFSLTGAVKEAENLIAAVYPELLPEFPSEASFRRRLDFDVPKAVLELGRNGSKAFDDLYGLYIRRSYEDMQSNEYWVSDTHTFDVIVETDNGYRYRPYLTAFVDSRSGMFVGWELSDNTGSRYVVNALRHAIAKHGAPQNWVADNGRENCNYDVGGMGHRHKAKQREDFIPPSIAKRLGITVHYAIPKNAKAKPIERSFRDIKDFFSRLFNTFVGGNILEKPDEKLRQVLKNGNVISEKDFKDAVNLLIEYEYNETPYNGSVIKDKGKTKKQIYYAYLSEKQRRVPNESELNLLMMRSTKAMKVGRPGVHITIDGYRIEYCNDELKMLQGNNVYLRWDPADLKQVRVYDEEDRLLVVAPTSNELVCTWGDDEEKIKAAMAYCRRWKKTAREFLDDIIDPNLIKVDALDLHIAAAQRRKENEQAYEGAKVVELVTTDSEKERPLYQEVAGLEGWNVIDYVANMDRNNNGG
ncbi:MAG: transposase family protein [Oscillospiraceae bacterium]|nr:transposase family protein [Oscillospiraceae bacterium]